MIMPTIQGVDHDLKRHNDGVMRRDAESVIAEVEAWERDGLTGRAALEADINGSIKAYLHGWSCHGHLFAYRKALALRYDELKAEAESEAA